MKDAADWSLSDRLAPARRSDPALDYCLWAYDPPALSRPDSLRASALLYHSLHAAGLSARALAVCDAIRAAVGDFGTVFGIKHAEGRLSWEFYFYDYDRLARRFDTRRLAATLAPFMEVTFPLTGDRQPYFMVSVELTPDHFEGAAPLDRADLYIGNPGSAVSSGLCYGLSAEGMEFRNAYFFFDAARQRPEIENKLTETAHAPVPFDPSLMLWPEVSPGVIVLANKRHNDGVYFSRITAADLAHCLDRLEVPAPLAGFARENASRFGHLLFDVGYDWIWQEGRPRPIKASWYGIF